MKHILLIILFVSTCSLASYAQLDKNTWLTGGSASFYSYSEKFENLNATQNSHFKEINLDAIVGYFIVDKLSLGVQSSFKYYKGRTDDGLSYPYSPFLIYLGPNFRYYFLNSEKSFNLLTDITYQYGIYKNITEISGIKGNGNNLSAMAGTEVFFNEIAGLELLFGYRQTNYKEKYPNGNTNILKKDGLFMSIGFKLHLVKK